MLDLYACGFGAFFSDKDGMGRDGMNFYPGRGVMMGSTSVRTDYFRLSLFG